MSAIVLQLQKRASYIFQNIQDKTAYTRDNQTFALVDGATQGFNSERWATILADSFVSSPTYEPEKIIDLFTCCARKFVDIEFTYSTNPAIAALEKDKKAKGASAAFLGLQFFQNNDMKAISCGDTNLFVMDKQGKILACFPYKTVEKLNENKNFLNTVSLSDQKIDNSFFQTKQIRHKKGVTYIMATDSLSRLFMKNNSTIHEFMRIDNFKMLHKFCIKYWDKKTLEEDDISAIVIKPDNNNKMKRIVPPANFTFPRAREFEFIPVSSNSNEKLNFTDMQMQKIYQQFSGVVNDFREVKRNQKITQILVIIAIVFIILNFAGLVYMICERGF